MNFEFILKAEEKALAKREAEMELGKAKAYLKGLKENVELLGFGFSAQEVQEIISKLEEIRRRL